MTSSLRTRPALTRDASFELGSVLAKARGENFPVASRLLPVRVRRQLLAIYGFARFVDDVGDLAPGDRLAALEWAEAELDRALDGRATHPVFVAAGRLAAELGLDRRPFADLIAANRLDQEVKRYPTWEALEHYCSLSANPVGRLVLAVFGQPSAEAAVLSDRICTALQVVEHLQDVREDFAAGRVYLPAEDLARFGVEEADLAAAAASPRLRRAVAFEAGRARRLLVAGAPLIGLVPGAGRVAIAGFVGGGLAQLDALEAAAYDVLARPVKARRAAVARWTVRVALGRGAGSR
ncbi:MAG TPA: squalene synthase HpnC [Acidimicrobiales bacterium]|jgi:squalene synthase HpnC|nr:squalene synthase HpnC [Acidimicrobiales bacterium]